MTFIKNKVHRFSLENDHGRKKVICPNCGKKSLTLYIDDVTGEPISQEVGRCDHESSCGYHRTPKEYFKDHPNKVPHPDRIVINSTVKKKEPKKVCYFPDAESVIKESESIDTTFSQFLRKILPSEDYERVCHKYHLGGWCGTSFRAKSNDRTIFWQIDKEGKVRDGKAIVYNEDGHRRKSVFPSWMHTVKTIPEGWEISQCLFGEHLLSDHPEKTVILVEAEKTSIIGSALFPEYVWLATGGKSSKIVEKCQVLSGRKVIIYPDIDGHDAWVKYAKGIKKSVKDCKVIVSDVLKNNVTPDEAERKIDIADWMIEELQSKSPK